MNLLDELKCQLVSEANDIKTFIELNKCIGTIVMLDQMLMIKVAFLTVAFKGGHSNVAEQTHNELTKQNYKLIDDFFDAGMRRKYHMYEYRQELRTVNCEL